IQRRHQKIVEEAPSPLVERVPGMRDRLFDASVAAAQAIGYTGAGTVEFLADDDGEFFFLEMNTRLQVEHPVTECTTGLDLVALQLDVAQGGQLADHPPVPQGHSIEVRLYAEDPASNWQPQSGTLHRIHIPGVRAEFEVLAKAGVRLDSGVADGSVVGIHYDPMLAKVISWAPTRDEASRRLAGALERSQIHGIVTNRDLLVNTLRHPAFLAGQTDTAFIDRHGLDTLATTLADPEARSISALAAALASAAANRASARVLAGLPSGWRNISSQPLLKRYRCGEDQIDVSYALGRHGLTASDHPGVTLLSATPTLVVLEHDGVSRRFAVATYRSLVCVDSPLGAVSLEPIDRFPDTADQVAPGSLLAPMPGSVVRVAVAVGDMVEKGQPLLWLEAMKMQHQVSAPVSGVVTELPVQPGQQVDVGAVLAVVQPDPSPTEEQS
ncbi:MAG: biotin/lipoyl-containing protein, partial [Aquihabitans sp.]